MARARKTSLQTIAEAVGLSKYAVSRSLAGKSGVSDETRALVLAAAETLGYVRAPSSDTHEVAVVFYDLDPVNSELYMRYQSGIQQEAHRLGIGVRIHWLHGAEQLAELIERCSGMLLIGPHSRETIATVAAAGVPMVRLGWAAPLEDADVVVGTDHEGGQAVAQYLIDLGHRDILYVYGSPRYRGRHERFYGAREVAEANAGVTLKAIQFEEHGGGFADAYAAIRATGFQPTAFFCSHDGLALTVISELLSQGFRIPDDVSIVGYGDYSIAQQITPALTTVRVQGSESGGAALRLLNDRMERPRQPGDPAHRIQVVANIVERRSAGPLKKI